MKDGRKRPIAAAAAMAAALVLAGCASAPKGPAPETEKAEFSLSKDFGERTVIDFDVAAAGTIRVQAAWSGDSSDVALILNGPGKVGYYKRVDAASATSRSLSLSQAVTPEILALGTEWKASIVNFDGKGSAKGTMTVSYPGAEAAKPGD